MAWDEPTPDQIAAKLREMSAAEPMVPWTPGDERMQSFAEIGNLGGAARLPFDQMRPSQNVTEYPPPPSRISDAFNELTFKMTPEQERNPPPWNDTSGNKALLNAMKNLPSTQQQIAERNKLDAAQAQANVDRYPIYDQSVGRDIDRRGMEARARMLPPVVVRGLDGKKKR